MTENEYLNRRHQEVEAELEDIRQKQLHWHRDRPEEDSGQVFVSAPRMLTIKETAKETHLAENYLRFLCRTDAIVYVRAGNKYLINYEKLVEFLNGKGGIGNARRKDPRI